jgi:hypothetical protein
VGLILRTTHGISDYFACPSRAITFLVLSIGILGVPTMTIVLLIENQKFSKIENPTIAPIYEFSKPLFDFIFVTSPTSIYRFYLTALVLLSDVVRMLLLTWASWVVLKWYTKNEVKKAKNIEDKV